MTTNVITICHVLDQLGPCLLEALIDAEVLALVQTNHSTNLAITQWCGLSDGSIVLSRHGASGLWRSVQLASLASQVRALSVMTFHTDLVLSSKLALQAWWNTIIDNLALDGACSAIHYHEFKFHPDEARFTFELGDDGKGGWCCSDSFQIRHPECGKINVNFALSHLEDGLQPTLAFNCYTDVQDKLPHVLATSPAFPGWKLLEQAQWGGEWPGAFVSYPNILDFESALHTPLARALQDGTTIPMIVYMLK